jgi:hypothetical protein
MSFAIFIFGFSIGFWLLRYSNAMVDDIEKFGNWEPKWLFRPMGLIFILFLFSLPVVVGAGLVALCGYQFNLSEFLGERE